MRFSLVALALVVLGCGRLGFDPVDTIEDPSVDATVEVADDAAASTACATDGECGLGEFCDPPSGMCGAPGACRSTEPGGMCLDVVVCGCDGVEYGNDCLRRQAGTGNAGVPPCASGS